MPTDDKKGARKVDAQQPTDVGRPAERANLSTEQPALGRFIGRIYCDLNRNGQFEAGEPALTGLTVQLAPEAPTVGNPIRTCPTDANGGYSFQNVKPGNYCLEVPESVCIRFTEQSITSASPTVAAFPSNEASNQFEQNAGARLRAPSNPISVLQAGPCQESSIKLEPSGVCGNRVCLKSNGDTQTANFGYALAASCIFGYVFCETDAGEICDKRISGSATAGSQTLQDPFEDVPVALLSNGVPVANTFTNEQGYFQFRDVGFGFFSLKLPLEFNGKSLSSATDTFPMFVPPGAEIGPNVITYDCAPATVSGRVTLGSGPGLGGLTVRLLERNVAAGSTPREFSAVSDEDGTFAFNNVPRGDWAVQVDDQVPTGIPGTFFTLDGSTRPQCPLKVKGSMTIPTFVFRSGVLIENITNQFQQLIDAKTACCTPHATQPPSTAMTVRGPGGAVAFDQVVDSSLASILGTRIGTNPARIVAQLTSAFEKKQCNGKDYYEWRPRGTTSLDSPQGVQISGTQATFYQQATDIQDRTNRLLDVVEPTFLDPDEEEIDTLKEDIRASLTSIVGEFGRPGGALQQRVDVLIINLNRDTADLKVALGINPAATSEREMDIGQREQNEANFALLEVYVKDLESAWNTFKAAINAFGTTAQITTFKGTALARLLWAVEAIPSSVQEVYAAMDFVGFGAVDRRVTSIGSNSATVEQLLLWIETSAFTDWPNRLVRGGARLNEVEAVKQEALAQSAALTTLTNAIGSVIQAGAGVVTQALNELGRQLREVVNVAKGIKP